LVLEAAVAEAAVGAAPSDQDIPSLGRSFHQDCLIVSDWVSAVAFM
jgi:hypothetical protein